MFLYASCAVTASVARQSRCLLRLTAKLRMTALQPAWILACREYILRFLNHLPFDCSAGSQLRANDPHNTFSLSCEPAEQSKGILTIRPQTPAARVIFSVHRVIRFCVDKGLLGVEFLVIVDPMYQLLIVVRLLMEI